ncbi:MULTISPECIES: isoprenyl transferase [unclassified Spirosoma]|uniref:isoprenyl transferase n=1 Tax=unclassified Spirosoma TaxID=2621999 RepID=UPI00095CF6E4|nr:MULTISPECIES: isoprenyl transferase [unclassified Spirosoma]MBN8822267.1 isoprenyl transferase [Spirosoma sp.]OJW72424.1 MAG: di-trans,poly-cis-decaprenylcistransferase [Spirosoma sp. 48-14]
MKEHINPSNLPQHIAVIMDGNGRWAKRQGAARVFGHRSAIKAVREVTEGCAELGVKYLTLYAFSTENWNRPKFEVDALMTLLVHTIRDEIKTLMNNNVRLATIGNIDSLPTDCRRELSEAIRETSQNTGLTLILALSYSGRWDIVEAAKRLAEDVRDGKLTPEQIDETAFSHHLTTGDIPDPELMIRTSGEMRISNFMLWQLAYAELYMPDVLWPDFRKIHLHEAIVNYQQRERRFGKISEQLVK